MTAPSQPARLNPESPVTPDWKILAAGTYDLVLQDPSGQKRPAVKIVCLANDTGWVLTDINNVASPSTAIPALFVHYGQTLNITCASPVAVYW